MSLNIVDLAYKYCQLTLFYYELLLSSTEAIPRSQRIRNAQDARADAVQYMLETGIRNVSKVARMFGITRKFLSNYVKAHNLEDQMPPPCEERSVYYRQLTYEEEEEIVEHCRKQESLGQPVHRTELREYMKVRVLTKSDWLIIKLNDQ